MDRCFSYNVSSNNRYTYPDICPKRYNAIRTMLSMLNRHCLITHKHCTLDFYCKCISFNNNKLLKVRWCNKWWCDVSKWTNRFTYFDRNKTVFNVSRIFRVQERSTERSEQQDKYCLLFSGNEAKNHWTIVFQQA